MAPALATLAAGCFLILAATLKLADRTGSAVALATLGLHGRAARIAVAASVAIEGGLGAALLTGSVAAAWAALGLLAGFAAVQAALLATGRGGMPCGCLGAHGSVGPVGIARTGGAAALAAIAAATGAPGAPFVLTAAALAATLVLAVRLTPRTPDGALDVAGEGPPVGEPAPFAAWLPQPDGRVRLALFTSATCRICRGLAPALEEIAGAGRVVLRTYEEERDREVWADAQVPGAPYAVAVAPDGRVLAKGTVNSSAQLWSVVRAAAGEEALIAAPAPSRRELLARAATLSAGAALAPAIGALVRPGEAAAYHFCGHIYTTDGCPHPTGLPRIDSNGRPLRARDGARVDDLGRPVDGDGRAVHDGGGRLADPDGRPLPRAPRTSVCQAAARRFGIRTRVDGAWYRCCGGQVRKLVDCCTYGDRRINGDAALTGYCYSGRKVFCVLYYDTRVPC